MKIYTDTLTYTETKKGNALLSEGKSIPKVPGNRDYDEYLERVEQGKAITEAYVAPTEYYEDALRKEMPNIEDVVKAILEDDGSIEDLKAAYTAVKDKHKNKPKKN